MTPLASDKPLRAREGEHKAPETGGQVVDPTRLVLERLEAVRRTGLGRWMARCPAHPDRTPSLSVREGGDGRVLLYDFAGCSAVEVVTAMGLDLADLFPRPLRSYSSTPPGRGGRRSGGPPISARDALEVLDREAAVVEMVGLSLAQGQPVERFREDLRLAARRIAAVRAAFLEVQP